MTQKNQATIFRGLHRPDARDLLMLPNAWDAMSARVIEAAGASAIATTSCGVAWALGRQDGEGATREEMLGALRRVADVVRVPVTADIESGYGRGTPADVAETIRGVIGAGAVGVNLEDSPGREGNALLQSSRQAERIAAARAAALAEGVDVFINARIDMYLLQIGAGAQRFDETVRRARVYIDAGADGIFVPGVMDATVIGKLAGSVDAPLNVMAAPGAPLAAELRRLGVRRVSVGPGITKVVMTQIRRAARELLDSGTYESLRGGMAFDEANGLFAGPVKTADGERS